MGATLDRSILMRFVRGDEEAFEAVYRHYERDVFRWIARIVRDGKAAEEVVVEAFWTTLFLLVIVAVHAFLTVYFEVPSQFVLGYPALPLDRAFLFPMAVVPNSWGLWNMLYLALRSRVRVAVGIFGSLLVLLLVPGGVALTRLFDTYPIQMDLALPMVPIGMLVYYLAWKYAVGPLNAEMAIA